MSISVVEMEAAATAQSSSYILLGVWLYGFGAGFDKTTLWP